MDVDEANHLFRAEVAEAMVAINAGIGSRLSPFR